LINHYEKIKNSTHTVQPKQKKNTKATKKKRRQIVLTSSSSSSSSDSSNDSSSSSSSSDTSSEDRNKKSKQNKYKRLNKAIVLNNDVKIYNGLPLDFYEWHALFNLRFLGLNASDEVKLATLLNYLSTDIVTQIQKFNSKDLTSYNKLVRLLTAQFQLVVDRASLALTALGNLCQLDNESTASYASRALSLVEDCESGGYKVPNRTSSLHFSNGLRVKLQEAVNNEIRLSNQPQPKNIKQILQIAERIEKAQRNTYENNKRLRPNIKTNNPNNKQQLRTTPQATTPTATTDYNDLCIGCHIKVKNVGFDTCSRACSVEVRKKKNNFPTN
jgi:hypothetical protein